jgi:hypothetical protein
MIEFVNDLLFPAEIRPPVLIWPHGVHEKAPLKQVDRILNITGLTVTIDRVAGLPLFKSTVNPAHLVSRGARAPRCLARSRNRSIQLPGLLGCTTQPAPHQLVQGAARTDWQPVRTRDSMGLWQCSPLSEEDRRHDGPPRNCWPLKVGIDSPHQNHNRSPRPRDLCEWA